MPIRLKIRRRGALAFCFVSLASPSWGADPRVHRIGIDNLAFGPAPAGLHVNDIVEWTNSDILRHTATATDGSFDVDLPAGATGQTILKRAGRVSYVCRFHPGMKGRLEVAP
jgi:plastocyanin